MILINLAGFILIGLIVWWFWLYKPVASLASAKTTIKVADGVYTPAHIKIAAGKATTLNFLREDKAPCSEMLLIPELGISVTLPINKITTIDIPASPAGSYAFHCQMQMYRGDITVE
ncbi:MAG: plastocyanin [Marinomonas sp.]|jgi:plastocyanin domain-containing protein|nr:plastocyanin [Marinomonas sp.]RUM50979.1 MAG: cupredoxin domain-containing protein [Marinomonas sp.]|tara:strand:+ start:177 stop:527 length:351 start_codon:yes stop_codon:yes gene_type:complete